MDRQATRLAAGFVLLVILGVLAQEFLFDGSSSQRPGRESEPPTATPPAQTPEAVLVGEQHIGGGAPAPEASVASVTSLTYEVKAGDTLDGIAAQLDVAPAEMASWIEEVLRLNDVRDTRGLHTGQVLKLPEWTPGRAKQDSREQEETREPAATPGPGGPPEATPEPATYTVVDGDYPLLIAEKLCVEQATSWAAELLRLNGSESASLRVGQVLRLPADTPATCEPGADAGTADAAERGNSNGAQSPPARPAAP